MRLVRYYLVTALGVSLGPYFRRKWADGAVRRRGLDVAQVTTGPDGDVILWVVPREGSGTSA